MQKAKMKLYFESWFSEMEIEFYQKKMSELFFRIRIGDIEKIKSYLDVDDLQKAYLLFARNKDNHTTLSYACRYGNTEVVKLLIEAGADVNERDKSANTPLHGLVGNKQCKEIVKLLIEHGADVNAMNEQGWTVQDVINAYQSGKKERIVATMYPKIK